MINYLLEVSLYQLLLFSIYYLFFRRNTFFQLNRFVLLVVVSLPFVLPFISFSEPIIVDTNVLPEIVLTGTADVIKEIENTKIYSLSSIIIVLGQILFFAFTLLKLNKLFILIRTNSVEDKYSYKIVETKKPEVFSWFSYIFAPNSEINEKVLKHELVHVRQKHSIDILLIEFISNVLWFNPFLKIIKNEMDLLHEYEADEKASLGTKVHYAEYLVTELFQVKELSLVHNFVKVNQIKKRIKMLTKMKTNKTKMFRYLLLIPILAIFSMEYSCEKNESVYKFEDVDKQPEVIGVDESLSKEDKYLLFQKHLVNHIRTNFKYPEEAKKLGIEGRVIISYLYDTKGKVSDVKVIRGIDKLLDDAALDIVKSLPDVNPAFHNGEPVAVSFMMPITFKLE